MNTKGDLMSVLYVIGIVLAVSLVIMGINDWWNASSLDKDKKVSELKPPEPTPESQAAINARVKMSAEIASLTSHLEQIEVDIDRLNKNVADGSGSLWNLKEKVNYQAGEIAQITKQLQEIASRPAPKFPTRMRLDLVNYKGQMKKAAKQAEEKK